MSGVCLLFCVDSVLGHNFPFVKERHLTIIRAIEVHVDKLMYNFNLYSGCSGEEPPGQILGQSA